MPPLDSERSLSQEEKGVLAAWILQGAEYEPHWAYLPPQRALAPLQPWVENPIDGFVLAKLHELGLTPSPEANPVTLVRRLSFDL